jgi:hypothetical protein
MTLGRVTPPYAELVGAITEKNRRLLAEAG